MLILKSFSLWLCILQLLQLQLLQSAEEHLLSEQMQQWLGLVLNDNIVCQNHKERTHQYMYISTFLQLPTVPRGSDFCFYRSGDLTSLLDTVLSLQSIYLITGPVMTYMHNGSCTCKYCTSGSLAVSAATGRVPVGQVCPRKGWV